MHNILSQSDISRHLRLRSFTHKNHTGFLEITVVTVFSFINTAIIITPELKKLVTYKYKFVNLLIRDVILQINAATV